MQFDGASPQYPDSLHEHHGMTVRVADGLTAILRRVLIADASVGPQQSVLIRKFLIGLNPSESSRRLLL